MNPKKSLPTRCPACDGELRVRSLHCAACDTIVSGDFRLSPFLRLPPDEQSFLLEFIKCSGSLKEMAARRSLSYPTVRNRLDDIIDHLEALENDETAC